MDDLETVSLNLAYVKCRRFFSSGELNFEFQPAMVTLDYFCLNIAGTALSLEYH